MSVAQLELLGLLFINEGIFCEATAVEFKVDVLQDQSR